MLIRTPLPSASHEFDVTPESIYLSRRRLLAAAGGFAALSILPDAAQAQTSRYADVDAVTNPQGFEQGLGQARWRAITAGDEALMPFRDATRYNNFYEFGPDKGDPARCCWRSGFPISRAG